MSKGAVLTAVVISLGVVVAPAAGAKTTPTTKPAPTTTTTTLPPPKPLPKPGGTVAWAPQGRSAVGQPLLYLASSGGAQMAWMPPGLTRAVVVPGTGDPLKTSWGGQVDPGSRPLMVAAFNGGFMWGAFSGGVLALGVQSGTMADGVASFVVFANGSSTVALWGRDVTTATPNVVAVRQNLSMLVDGGAPTQAAISGSWGASVAGIATARSALGVDANGGLVWAGGRLSPIDLANALVAGGAVRGMQMDINPDWVNFNLYTPGADGVVHGSPVYGATGTDRYLTPNSRDFVAVLIQGTVVPGDSGKVGQPAVVADLRLPKKKS